MDSVGYRATQSDGKRETQRHHAPLLNKLLSRQVSRRPSVPGGRSNERSCTSIPVFSASIPSAETLSSEIVARQRALRPGAEVVYRDLRSTLPFIFPVRMAVFQGGAVSDPALAPILRPAAPILDDLFAADIIVIAHQCTFLDPSQLKAWIDRVVVAGKSFRYGETARSLLPKDRRCSSPPRAAVSIRATARQGSRTSRDLPEGVLSFIGLTDITSFAPRASTLAGCEGCVDQESEGGDRRDRGLAQTTGANCPDPSQDTVQQRNLAPCRTIYRHWRRGRLSLRSCFFRVASTRSPLRR